MSEDGVSAQETFTPFIDESYVKDSWYFLAACVMSREAERKLDDSLNAVLVGFSDLGVHMDTEFHGYEIFHGERVWAPLKDQSREVHTCLSLIVLFSA